MIHWIEWQQPKCSAWRLAGRYALAAFVVAAFAMTGCVDSKSGEFVSVLPSPKPKPKSMAPQERRGEREGFVDSICNVVSFFPVNTWQSFDNEGDRNPEGFAFVLYLISCKTGKGGFGDGLVHVNLYRIDRGPRGATERELVQNWTIRHKELNPRQPARLGYGYQPTLFWGDNVDLLGKEVEIVVRYEAPDGAIVQGQTVHRKVPGPKV